MAGRLERLGNSYYRLVKRMCGQTRYYLGAEISEIMAVQDGRLGAGGWGESYPGGPEMQVGQGQLNGGIIPECAESRKVGRSFLSLKASGPFPTCVLL